MWNEPALFIKNKTLECVYAVGDGITYLLLRMVAGGNLIPHGWGKIDSAMNSPEGMGGFAGFVGSLGFPLPIFFAWTAALAEFAGGILILLGLLTRPIALACIFLMTVITFGVHWERGFDNRDGGFEYPLMWLIVLMVVFVRGSGKYSLDALLLKKQF